jgi:hypothetical protein
MRFAFPRNRPIRGTSAASRGRPLRRLLPLLLATALLVLAGAPSARADVGATIIERCTHGESLGGFSQQDYQRALQELPTEVEEYSECGNLIRRAQLAAAGGGGGSGLGAGAGAGPGAAVALPLTPAERSALRQIAQTGGAPQLVGNEVVYPGVVHASVASALSSLPNSVLALLAFLLACGLVLAGRVLRNRVHARRSS